MIKLTSDPNKIASPNRIISIPRYIGCLLMENGPVLINIEGTSFGLTVVLYLLKRASVHTLRIIPIIKSNIPLILIGNINNVSVGNKIQIRIFIKTSI
jgi:hypothetical protein